MTDPRETVVATREQSEGAGLSLPQRRLPGSSVEVSSAPADRTAQRIIVALLFLATTVNYVDRAVLGVLKPMLDVDLGWNQIDYGWMVTAFQATYAVGYLLAGRWFDQIGMRTGLLIAVSAWSFAAGAHALAHTVIGFVIARSLLGLAEGGFFPAACSIKRLRPPDQLKSSKRAHDGIASRVIQMQEKKVFCGFFL